MYGAYFILLATIILTSNTSGFSLSQNWKGDVLFLAGGAFFASYVLLSRHWQVNTMQVLLCGAVVNAIIYLPVWWLLLPSGIAQTDRSVVLLQGVLVLLQDDLDLLELHDGCRLRWGGGRGEEVATLQ